MLAEKDLNKLETKITHIEKNIQASFNSNVIQTSEDIFNEWNLKCKPIYSEFNNISGHWISLKDNFIAKLVLLENERKSKLEAIEQNNILLKCLQLLAEIHQIHDKAKTSLLNGQFSTSEESYNSLKSKLEEFQSIYPFHVKVIQQIQESREYDLVRLKALLRKYAVSLIKCSLSDKEKKKPGLGKLSMSISPSWNVELLGLAQRLNIRDEILTSVYENLQESFKIFFSNLEGVICVSIVDREMVLLEQNFTSILNLDWKASTVDNILTLLTSIVQFLKERLLLTSSSQKFGSSSQENFIEEIFRSIKIVWFHYLLRSCIPLNYKDMSSFTMTGSAYDKIRKFTMEPLSDFSTDIIADQSTSVQVNLEDVFVDSLKEKLKRYFIDISHDRTDSLISIPLSSVNQIKELDALFRYEEFCNWMYENEIIRNISEENRSEMCCEKNGDKNEITAFVSESSLKQFLADLISTPTQKISESLDQWIKWIKELVEEMSHWTLSKSHLMELVAFIQELIQSFAITRKNAILSTIPDALSSHSHHTRTIALLFNESNFISYHTLLSLSPRLHALVPIQNRDSFYKWSLETILEQRRFADEIIYEFVKKEKAYILGLLRSSLSWNSIIMSHESLHAALESARKCLLDIKVHIWQILPSFIYARTLGLLYDSVLVFMCNHIIEDRNDLSEEECSVFHALGLSVSVWSKEFFTTDVNDWDDGDNDKGFNMDMITFDQLTHMSQLTEAVKNEIEKQVSFIPHWLSFQQLIYYLDWNMKDIVQWTMKYTSTSSSIVDGDWTPLEDYLLSKEQVRHLILIIFGESELRTRYLNLLSK